MGRALRADRKWMHWRQRRHQFLVEHPAARNARYTRMFLVAWAGLLIAATGIALLLRY